MQKSNKHDITIYLAGIVLGILVLGMIVFNVVGVTKVNSDRAAVNSGKIVVQNRD